MSRRNRQAEAGCGCMIVLAMVAIAVIAFLLWGALAGVGMALVLVGLLGLAVNRGGATG